MEASAVSQSPSRLLDAIDFEVEVARHDLQRPGWSPWAFAAAIASVAWVLLDQVGAGHYSAPRAPLLTAYAFLFTEGLRTLWASWCGCDADCAAPRFFRPARSLRRSKPHLVLQILLPVAALLAHLLLPPLVPALLWWTATLVLAFLNILCALTLVALFTSWPVPVRNANPARVSRRHAVLTLCLVAWSLLLLASAFPSDPAAFLGDARAAGLSLALLYLVQGWLSQPEKSPLLDELAELRRGILLDGLDPAAAARQLRLLVQGADIEEMARPHVLACLRAIATAEGEVRRCTEELKAFCDLLGREVCPLRAPEQSMGVTVFESQKRRLAAAAEARRAAVLAYGEMKVRLARLGKLRPAESRVVEQMDAYIIERDSGIDALEGQRQALAQDVARTLAARALPSSPQPAAKS